MMNCRSARREVGLGGGGEEGRQAASDELPLCSA